MRLAGNFDYLVINQEDKLDETVSRINAIITAEMLRMPPGIDLIEALK